MSDFCKICDPKCKHNDCICNENFSNFYDTYNELQSVTQLDKFTLVKNWIYFNFMTIFVVLIAK